MRVAGNIVHPDCFGTFGRLNYGIEELTIPFLLILGHEGYGAVQAVMKAIEFGVIAARLVDSEHGLRLFNSGATKGLDSDS